MPQDTGEEFDDDLDLDQLDDDEPQGEREDEIGDQDPPQEGDDQDDPPARQPSRAERRIEELDRRTREFERLAQEAATRAENAERQLRELQSGTSRAATEREEQARLAAMDPEERIAHLARTSEARTAGQIDTLRREIAESTDRAAFATACASNPTLAKVKDQVETELTKLRSQGQNVAREVLAKYLLGEEILKKAPQAKARAERRAAANRDRERSQPARGASDAPRGGGRDDKAARDARVESYVF